MNIQSMFKRKANKALVNCEIVICLKTKNRDTSTILSVAVNKWHDLLKRQNKLSSNNIKFNDQSKSYTKVYFAPYALELFLKYYKALITNNIPIPGTDGDIFHSLDVDVEIIYNIFNSKQDLENDILDSQHTLEAYHTVPFINENFTSVLMSLYTLIFFYNYTPNKLMSSNTDPRKIYNANVQLANYIKAIYLKEHNITSQMIATMPSYNNFERQNVNSIYIPALSLTKVQYSNSSSIPKHSLSTTHPQKNPYTAPSSTQPRSNIINNLSNNTQDSNLQSPQNTDNTAYTPYVGSGSNSDSSEANREAQAKAIQEDNSLSASESVENSKAQKNESKASSAQSGTKSSSSDNSSNQSVITADKKDKGKNLISVDEFKNNYFPMTDKPEIIESAVQLLLDDDPGLFHSDVHFQHFHVNHDLDNPVPIQEAIKTGKMDDQKYVLEMDNEFKKIANEVITGRQNVLNMSYTRYLINLVTGAQEKLNKSMMQIIQNASDNTDLHNSAQLYYNKHFSNGFERLKADKKTETNAIKKALKETYLGKLHANVARINSKYNKRRQQLGNDINRDTIHIYEESEKKRDDEVQRQGKAIKDNDVRHLRLQIKNMEIEFSHKISQASNLLFDFLHSKLKKNHVQALDTVSELIKKQVKLNKSQINLRQARLEISNAPANSHLKTRMVKVQKKYQDYIKELRSEISDLRNKLQTISAGGHGTTDKLNKAIINNRDLESKLKGVVQQLSANKEAIRQGKVNSKKYQQERQKNAEQQKKFNAQLSSLNNSNNKTVANSAAIIQSASASASASASKAVAEHDDAVDSEGTSYSITIAQLRAQLSNSSGNKARNNSSATGVQQSLAHMTSAFHNFKLSVSASTSVRNASQASHQASVAKQNTSYQALINVLQGNLKNGSGKSLNTNDVNALSSVVDKFSSFKASVSNSDNAQNKSLSSRYHRYENTIAKLQGNISHASTPGNGNVDTSRISVANAALAQTLSSFKAFRNSVANNTIHNNNISAATNADRSAMVAEIKTSLSNSAKDRRYANEYNRPGIHVAGMSQPQQPRQQAPQYQNYQQNRQYNQYSNNQRANLMMSHTPARRVINQGNEHYSPQLEANEKLRMEQKQKMDRLQDKINRLESKRNKPRKHLLPWQH